MPNCTIGICLWCDQEDFFFKKKLDLKGKGFVNRFGDKLVEIGKRKIKLEWKGFGISL